ncbi:MAG: hypothetical protein U0930_15220 [Pirellulales bacterium]
MIITQEIDRTILIGIAHVLPFPGNEALGKAKGAFVNLLGFAEDETEFTNLAIEFMKLLEFEVVKIIEIERYSDREANGLLSEEITELKRHLTASCPMGCSTFDSYLDE